MERHILLVDDDTLFRRTLRFNLEQAGYKVTTAGNAEDALAFALLDRPTLILLDIGLPGMDGLEALRHFENEVGSPVIFVTARRRELEEALGLELGAEDYITKPFDIDVLLARIKVVLRRVQHGTVHAQEAPRKLSRGDLIIDPTAHNVMVGGRSVHLSPIEFKLIYVLASEVGKVFSTNELLGRVWGTEYVGEPQVVYVHLRGLRKKLEKNPSKPERLVTVRGVGYKFVVQEQ